MQLVVDFDSESESEFDEFNLKTFLKMISINLNEISSNSNNFKNVKVSEMIYKENRNNFESKFWTFNQRHFTEHYNIPHFPEISLELLKVYRSDKGTIGVLINNAIVSPFLFDKFFKFLSENVIFVSRNELKKTISRRYSSVSRCHVLGMHQILLTQIHYYLANERVTLTLVLLYGIYKFLSVPLSDYILIPAFVYTAFILHSIFHKLGVKNYLEFEDISRFEIVRFVFYKLLSNFYKIRY